MKILIIGATGFVGRHLARGLVTAGHDVGGLARTDDAADWLRQAGVVAVRGDFDQDRSGPLTAAREADAVIVAAQPAPEAELEMVTTLLDAVEGTGATFVFTSGSGVMLHRSEGAWSPDSYDETDDFPVEPLARTRHAVEELVVAAADRRLRTMVVRPGMIWGPGDHGHVAMIYESVARTGAACYVGAGLNVYANVHVDDVTRLYDAALADGQPGAVYHAVAGETPTRWIAQSVAADLGVPTRSVTWSEAVAIWGEFGALIVSGSSRLRATRSHHDLNWIPRHHDMLTAVGESRYRQLAALSPNPLL